MPGHWWQRWPVRRLDPPVGYSVRAEHRDGSHEFLGYHADAAQAMRAQDKLLRYWKGGPAAPTAFRVVPIDRTSWSHHHRIPACRSPECPGSSTPPET